MTTSENFKKLLNEKELASILDIEPTTLRIWRWKGVGPQFRKIGSNVRYHPDDVTAYINAACRQNTSQKAAI